MDWTPSTMIALVALVITVAGHLVSVSWFLAKTAASGKKTEEALVDLRTEIAKDLDRIYVKLDAFAVSQRELAELRGVVDGLRERLHRVEDRQDGRR